MSFAIPLPSFSLPAFANARNPQAVQTRYQLNLSRHTLEELNQFLSAYLSFKQEADHVSN